MADGLQSPGPGWRYLHYSDGEGAWISPRATEADWAEIKKQGEAERDQKYQAQAKAENRPITTTDKVYSSTGIYPNNAHGHVVAWVDHNLGGNRLNTAVRGSPGAQAVVNAVAPVVGSASRIGTAAMERNPAVGAVDLGLTGVNVGKHVLAKAVPGVNAVPDFPTLLSQVRGIVGTPELSPDASMEQRILENAASVVAGSKPSAPATTSVFGRPPPTPGGFADQILNATGHAALSHVGGLAGEELLGEPGQFIGSFLTPGGPRAIAQRTLAPFFRTRGQNTTTQDVSAAADRQGIQPTLGSVSNSMGRLFEKAVAATPGVGGAARAAQERFNEAIRQRQQEVGEDVFGGPLPGNISDESIGQSLVSGARQGAANITQRAKDEQNQLMTDVGSKTPVDARGVYHGPAGYTSARLKMGSNEYPAYAARLDGIRDAAIQAQMPFWQQFWGQLKAGEVPYERFQRLRNSLGQDIQGFAGMAKGDQDQLYEAMTDAMRDAAFQRGGQKLADQFDAANANYKALLGAGGKREQLEAVGGKPQSGGWDQFVGPKGAEPAQGVDFTGGKGQAQAAEWFKGNLRSPDNLAPFADPRIVPNEFWREAVGQWLASRGRTPEGTYRPDQMARELGGEDVKSNTGVGGDVQTQLFAGPGGQPTANIGDVNDIATLGRNAVVPINRAGLTDTAGSVFALKWLADQAQHLLGTAGGIGAMAVGGRGLSDPAFVNAVRGQGTPLVDSLYSGVPAATQNILQYQNNPPSNYDPLGYAISASQNPR